ncbi:MAG: hypothetical protein ACLFWR_11930 [Acidimicrobiales bacterium]
MLIGSTGPSFVQEQDLTGDWGERTPLDAQPVKYSLTAWRTTATEDHRGAPNCPANHHRATTRMYETDGVSTTVDDVTALELERTDSRGETIIQEIHLRVAARCFAGSPTAVSRRESGRVAAESTIASCGAVARPAGRITHPSCVLRTMDTVDPRWLTGPAMADHIEGDRFRVSVADGGVVRVDHPDGADVTGSDAEAIVAAIASLTAGVRSPLLVDLRSVGTVRRPARTAFAELDVASRVALLVGSPLSRMLASFGLGLNRPERGIPVKVFEDEASARHWLLDQGHDA